MAVPQDRKPNDLFDAASAPVKAESLSGALLVCRATTTTAVGPDLSLRVSANLPGVPSLVSDSAEGSASLVFSVPGLAFKKGDRVTLSGTLVESKCRVGLLLGFLPVPVPACTETKKPIGNVAMEFDGALPMVGKGGELSVECRGWDAAGVETKLQERLAGAQSDLDGLCKRFVIDPQQDGFGWPGTDDMPVKSGLTDAAAVGGWADPRVKALLGFQIAMHSEWTRELGTWSVAQGSKVTAPGAEFSWYDGLTAQVTKPLDCSAGAVARYKGARESAGKGEAACIVHLSLKAAADGGAPPDELKRPNIHVVSPSGFIAPAYDAEVRVDGKAVDSMADVRLAGGKTATEVLWVVIPKADATAATPVLARALDAFDARMFRVR